jgi:hypothetical protein
MALNLLNWLMHVHILRAGLIADHRREESSIFAGPLAFGLRYALRRLTGRTSSL